MFGRKLPTVSHDELEVLVPLTGFKQDASSDVSNVVGVAYTALPAKTL